MQTDFSDRYSPTARLTSLRFLREMLFKNKFQTNRCALVGGAAGSAQDREGMNIMQRAYKFLVLASCVALSLALAGCAETTYPRLPGLGGIGTTLLTPKEQEKAISDLATEQKSHGNQAAEEIEKR
jgi:hypothetical protein